MDRRDIGSWLSGPGSADDRPDQDYAGQLLGLPEHGPASVAGIGRRAAAILVDWLVAVFVVTFVSGGRLGFGAQPEDATATSWWTLAAFGGQVALLTWLGGASIGQRVLGLRVMRIDGSAVPPLAVVVRTALICLVIPAVVFDRDGRGLHDRAAASVVVRAR